MSEDESQLNDKIFAVLLDGYSTGLTQFYTHRN